MRHLSQEVACVTQSKEKKLTEKKNIPFWRRICDRRHRLQRGRSWRRLPLIPHTRVYWSRSSVCTLLFGWSSVSRLVHWARGTLNKSMMLTRRGCLWTTEQSHWGSCWPMDSSSIINVPHCGFVIDYSRLLPLRHRSLGPQQQKRKKPALESFVPFQEVPRWHRKACESADKDHIYCVIFFKFSIF